MADSSELNPIQPAPEVDVRIFDAKAYINLLCRPEDKQRAVQHRKNAAKFLLTVDVEKVMDLINKNTLQIKGYVDHFGFESDLPQGKGYLLDIHDDQMDILGVYGPYLLSHPKTDERGEYASIDSFLGMTVQWFEENEGFERTETCVSALTILNGEPAMGMAVSPFDSANPEQNSPTIMQLLQIQARRDQGIGNLFLPEDPDSLINNPEEIAGYQRSIANGILLGYSAYKNPKLFSSLYPDFAA